MDVWSGPAAPGVRASPPALTVNPTDFSLAFFKNKEQQPKLDHQHVAVDNTREGGKLAAPCKVCGDKASGYHYGVTSCEGCKGFFRRSIQKQIEYRCLRDGKCLVIRLNRNRCQFCRFKKCLSVGMSRDSVRYGRVPKRSRESSTENNQDLARNLAGDAPVPAQEETEADSASHGVTNELVKIVTAAHRTNNSYNQELRRALRCRPLMLSVEDSDDGSGGEEAAASSEDKLACMRDTLWQQLAYRLTPIVQQVVEFAKRLPGFHALLQDDQLILIKLGFFEVWATRASRLSDGEYLIFDDGTVITQQQLEIVYDPPFAQAMLNYIRSVAILQPSEEELATYTGSLLLYPHRAGLIDPERINALYSAITDAFHHTVACTGADDIPGRIEAYAAASREVRTLGGRHNELLSWCRVHWTRLALPELFSEVFDIPKNEEDPEQAGASTSETQEQA